MSTNCCQCSVPHHGSFEAFGPAVQAWQERLTTGLSRSIQASDQILEHLEDEAQKKADQAPPVCPLCGGKLNRLA